VIAALVALLASVQAAPAAVAPAQGVVLAPAVARPGDAVLVRVPAQPGVAVAGTLGERPLRFWEHGGERWALAALPIEMPPGAVPVTLEVGGAAMTSSLAVVEPGFPSKALRVAPRFVTPPPSARKRIEADHAAFARAYDRAFVPPRFAAPFAWPHPGAHHGRYGDQRTFNGKKASVHYGLDIDAPRGAPVRAASDGEVVLARDCYYSGKTVVLWHGADVYTLYFHMDRLDVRPGAKVHQGDRLGVVGSTGRSTGPHLHWSTKVGGLYVDPESIMGIDFAAGAAPPRRAGPPAQGAPAEGAAAPDEAGTTSATRSLPGREGAQGTRPVPGPGSGEAAAGPGAAPEDAATVTGASPR
jgi:murein DD-endopeptidase MepM/ murein hydrolase activator NlpD